MNSRARGGPRWSRLPTAGADPERALRPRGRSVGALGRRRWLAAGGAGGDRPARGRLRRRRTRALAGATELRAAGRERGRGAAARRAGSLPPGRAGRARARRARPVNPLAAVYLNRLSGSPVRARPRCERAAARSRSGGRAAGLAGARGREDPGRDRQGRARRPRPRRQGDRACAAGRRHGGDLHRPPPVARADRRDCVQEDADAVGISILSGAHMTLVPRIVDAPACAGRRTTCSWSSAERSQRTTSRAQGPRRRRGVHTGRVDGRDRRVPSRERRCVECAPDEDRGVRQSRARRARRPAARPGDAAGSTARASWRSRTSTLHRGRGGAAACASRPARARSSSSRWGPRAAGCAAQGARDGRRPRGLVSDEAFAGADLLGTAQALAGALAREGADLVLFGQQSADGDGACLWGAVAEHLRRPVISQVASSWSRRARHGQRQTEYGYERSARRCRRSWPSRMRSTSRATRR